MSLSIKVTNVACEASCVYCVSKGTPVMMDDGSWKKIEDVMVGERVISFEFKPEDKPGAQRRFVNTTVNGIVNLKDKLMEIRLVNGKVLKSTPNHEWLVDRGGHNHIIRTDKLKAGDKLIFLTEPIMDDVTQSSEYQLGWLSGVLNGDSSWVDYVDKNGNHISSIKLYSTEESILDRAQDYALSALGVEFRRVDSVRRDNGYELSYLHVGTPHIKEYKALRSVVERLPSQEDNLDFVKGWLAGIFDAHGTESQLSIYHGNEKIVDEIVHAWSKLGVDARKKRREGKSVDNSSPVWDVTVKGGVPLKAKFLSMCRPALLRKVSFEGNSINELPRVEIESVKMLEGEHDVYDLQTESLTFIADGYLTIDCYEQEARSIKSNNRPFDLDAILKAMEEEWNDRKRRLGGQNPKGEPYLHGGEALTAGHDTIERIMKKAYELAGRTNIQTYGYLIDKKYIEIFKKYNASVGISIDGPWPLNKARVVPGYSTKEITEIVHKNIMWLKSEGIPVSIITVLTKANATPDKLPKLKEWLLWLRDIGVNSGRLNLGHMDLKRYGKALELSPDEAEHAWRELSRFVQVEEDGLFWEPFRDSIESLLGIRQGTCIFGPCTYYRADAEPVILSDGTTANCLKTAKTGHMYPRLEQDRMDFRGAGGIRYEVLQKIPMEMGGCGGCRYWRNCLGGCPSEGIGGDWRNKTRFCSAYYGLFEEAEKVLRRTLPMAFLTTDEGVQFPNMGVEGMYPPAFARLLPMPLQKSLQQQQQKMQLDVKDGPGCYPPEIEHLDGNIRHIDSGLLNRGKDGAN